MVESVPAGERRAPGTRQPVAAAAVGTTGFTRSSLHRADPWAFPLPVPSGRHLGGAPTDQCPLPVRLVFVGLQVACI
jgi:hypothetical protein